jgi:ribosomal 30S subunit maturation factor RimM
MTVSVGLDLVGLTAFSRDGTKLGKLKDVFTDSESSCEYLVIGRRLARDLVIPADVVEMQGDRVLVPFASSFLNSAPALKGKGAVSPEERSRLQAFYHVRAAQD